MLIPSLRGVTPNASTGEIYGPVNGQYVTLAAFQAWQASQQSAIAAQNATAIKAWQVSNPSVPVPQNTIVALTTPATQTPVSPLRTTAPPAPTYTPRVTLTDTTNGSSLGRFMQSMRGLAPRNYIGLGFLGAFNVGDAFVLTVSGGAPNAPVTVALNGGTPTQIGSTDASGKWSTTGTWNSSTVGSYTEQYFVAGTPTNTLQFSVVTPTVASPSPSGSSGSVAPSPSVTVTDTGDGSALLVIGAVAVGAYFLLKK